MTIFNSVLDIALNDNRTLPLYPGLIYKEFKIIIEKLKKINTIHITNSSI